MVLRLLLLVAVLVTMVSSGFSAITEKDVIGTYKAVMDTGAMKPQDRQMMDQKKSIWDSHRLELKSGNVATLWREGKKGAGKWAIVSGKIVISPGNKGSRAMSFVPKGDGKTLVAVVPPSEQAKMRGCKITFVRI